MTADEELLLNGHASNGYTIESKVRFGEGGGTEGTTKNSFTFVVWDIFQILFNPECGSVLDLKI